MRACTPTDAKTDILCMTTRTNVRTRIHFLHARRPTHKHTFTHSQCADVYKSKLYICTT